MSAIGGDIGGKVGGAVGNSQFPQFESAGGVTPQQTALADYDYGQNLLEGQAQFEGSGQGGGPIDSTMATQTAGGANIGRALNLSQMSDVNQDAEFKSFENAINIDQQNQQNATQQSNQLQTTLGGLAGQNAAQNTPIGSSQ